MRKKINCPMCGKWLLSTEENTQGVVYIWCRKCRNEIRILIESR